MALFRINHESEGWSQPTIHIRSASLRALVAEVAIRYAPALVDVDPQERQAVVRADRDVFTLTEIPSQLGTMHTQEA